MKDVTIRKMLVDALRSHPHAGLLADVIVDCLRSDGYSGMQDLSGKSFAPLLIDAFAGIDHRTMFHVGSTVLVNISNWNSSKFDIPAMEEQGTCPADDLYVGIITEVNSYTSIYPYKVQVPVIEKDGTVKDVIDTYKLSDVKPWAKSR